MSDTEAATVPAVYKAMSGVMADMAKHGVGKHGENTEQGWAFRRIDDAMNALSPTLAQHGLLILPEVESYERHERATRSGGVLMLTIARVHFRFLAVADGSHVDRVFYGEAGDSGDKSLGKAMTYAYKEMLLKTFCVPVKGQLDPDEQAHEIASGMQPEVFERLKQRVTETGGDVDRWLALVDKSYPTGVPASALEVLEAGIEKAAEARARRAAEQETQERQKSADNESGETA